MLLFVSERYEITFFQIICCIPTKGCGNNRLSAVCIFIGGYGTIISSIINSRQFDFWKQLFITLVLCCKSVSDLNCMSVLYSWISNFFLPYSTALRCILLSSSPLIFFPVISPEKRNPSPNPAFLLKISLPACDSLMPIHWLDSGLKLTWRARFSIRFDVSKFLGVK